MIVLLDHIALTPKNLAEAFSVMRLLKYKPRFKQMNVSDLTIKRDLMIIQDGKQDLLLYDLKGNASLEIVNYGRANEIKPYIFPILEGTDVSEFKAFGKRPIGDINLTECRLLASGYHVLLGAERGNLFSLNAIAILVNRLEASIEFWEIFGFSLSMKGDDFAILESKFPLNDFSFRINLQESKEATGKHHLDDVGFNCIAFISNSVNLEKAILDKKGYKTTAIETFSLNERIYDVMFAVGPSGELVELLCVHR